MKKIQAAVTYVVRINLILLLASSAYGEAKKCLNLMEEITSRKGRQALRIEIRYEGPFFDTSWHRDFTVEKYTVTYLDKNGNRRKDVSQVSAVTRGPGVKGLYGSTRYDLSRYTTKQEVSYGVATQGGAINYFSDDTLFLVEGKTPSGLRFQKIYNEKLYEKCQKDLPEMEDGDF